MEVKMKGYKTLAFNGLVAVGGAALTYAAGVDWTQYVSPQTAIIIVTVANMVLRLMTSTPVGQKV